DVSLVNELARREVSVVFLDLGRPGEHMNNLSVDYQTGIEEAVRHLAELGHSDIAFVSGPEHLSSAARRLEAFRRSMKLHLPEARTRVCRGDFKLEGGRAAARELLSGGDVPSAVIAANDMMALGAMAEFRAAGLDIPGDISVVGFDDIAFAALAEPRLTTVCLPRDELGRRAVEALMLTVEHPERRGVEFQIPTHLVVRGSTAPARAAAARFGRQFAGTDAGRREM
ncbi:MAG TPA: substrate-binding domain-containing protein, partial [Pyrinomonadaceae bacterium]|nr:substrate-binding domain-containing protein [Pyrinomonadaceae bacterium]